MLREEFDFEKSSPRSNMIINGDKKYRNCKYIFYLYLILDSNIGCEHLRFIHRLNLFL